MKKAFTLAEVLITLGVIGVVAAITIPSLISNYQKKVIETTLKEDYSIMAQVNRMMIANQVDFDMSAADGSDAAIRAWFEENMLPYMHISNVCYSGTKGCWSYGTQTRYLNGATFGDCRVGYGCGGNWISYIMNNGTKVALDIGNNSQLRNIFGIDSEAETCLKIYVDVNGDKPPNKFGIDVFLMTFTDEGFVPAGVNKSASQLKQSCSKGGNGYWCMTYVRNNGWSIPTEIWKLKNAK